MLPRERVIMALNHQQPDRVPTDFWSVPEVLERLKDYFGTDSESEMLDKLEIDIRRFEPDYIGPFMKPLPDGTFINKYGTIRKKVRTNYGEYTEYAKFPLSECETVEEIRAYPYWPKLEHWDWDGFSEKIGNWHDTHFIKVDVGGPFEDSWGLRGLEQFMVDMVADPEIAHAIVEERTNFYISFVHKAMEVAGDKIDCFYTFDDIATQRGPMFSPAMWDEFVKPYHNRLSGVIKSYGKTILYHSCGAVVPFIDRLRDLPIDILNPLQPMADGMDLPYIKERWGHELSFHGAICIQNLLPQGTAQEVYEKTAETIQILGKDGGYILAAAHRIQNDTPTENILAMYQAGKDSINW